MHLGRVVEGEGVQHAVVVAELQSLDAAHVLGHKCPVRHHRAFGSGGGAGGVEDLHQVSLVHVYLGFGGIVSALRHA
jgi:hypothetical protein